MVRLLIVITLVSCTRTSEKYCGLHGEDRVHCPQMDAPVDPRTVCTTDPDPACSGETPRCLLQGGPTGFCVGCIDNSDCTQTGRQACDPDTRTCRACAEHSDCASLACLPEGTCGTDDNVVYVDETGTDAGDCTAAAKCRTIDYALDKITNTRFFLKLSGRLEESVL